ncbi:MAG TPA: hypothetical protein VGO60_00725 [Iamia sp.]|nr:hypothetical protein [Iamia sp.]
MTLAGAFASPLAVRVLGGTLIELFGDQVDTITVDVSPARSLSPAACHVLVDAARYARQAGGCLVASGLAVEERVLLRRYDVDHRVDLAR